MKDYGFEWNYFEPRPIFGKDYYSIACRLHNNGGISMIICDKDGGNIKVLSTEKEFQ